MGEINGDIGGDGSLSAGDQGEASNNGNAGVDLSGLFSPEEVTAKQESVAAAKAEETRRASLTDAEREAEDVAKAAENEKGKPPENYELKFPEGLEVNKELLSEFLPLAKEAGLTNEMAQKFVDVQVKMVAQRQTAWEGVKADWHKQASVDAEYGGDNIDKSLAIARRAQETFGTPELDTFLTQYGGSNHPEVIRFLYRVGSAVREDTMVTPGSSTGNSDLDARIKGMYGNSNMK